MTSDQPLRSDQPTVSGPLAALLRTNRGTAGSPRLLGGYSPSSGRHHFPRAEVCPYTGAEDIEEVMLPDTGRLWLWTAVTARPPGYAGPVPYGFGVVELDGIGLRVVTRLTESDPTRLRDGQAMRLVTEVLPSSTGTDTDTDVDLDDRLVVWAFESAEAPS